jgi:DNA-binding CsgD family transcriptional regulator
MLKTMKPPLFVRPLTEEERHHLESGLRSKHAFTLRRCQILLASAQQQTPAQIAKSLGCSVQTVRNALHAFAQHGPACLTEQSCVPRTVQPVLDAAKRACIHGLLHQSPRTFGKHRSTWTLSLLAEVCWDLGFSPQPLSAPTIRDAILRLGANWKRAKHWSTSPDPAYVRKKTGATA